MRQEGTSQTWNVKDPKMGRLSSVIGGAGESRENVMMKQVKGIEERHWGALKMLRWHLQTMEEGTPSQGSQQPLKTEKGKEKGFSLAPVKPAQLTPCLGTSSFRNLEGISL